MVNTGFNRAFGAGLRRMIANSTDNRFKAFMSGIVVTMLLQSSTAAVLILSSFAARGLIQVSGAIAVVLGADVGTTLVAQILSFDLSWLAPVLVATGFVINKALSDGQYKHVGRAMIGIGLILISLKMVVGLSEPLRESTALQTVIESLVSEPFLAILIAAVLTWLAHSSLAMVLLFATFVGNGTIPLEMGLILVLGANFGGAIAPMLMTAKSRPEGRHVPLANLLMRGVFVLVMVPLLSFITPYLAESSPIESRQLVNFHMFFNVALATCFILLVGTMAKVTKLIIPEQTEVEDKSQPRYLDESALTTPPVALACAARETLRISDYIQRMLRETLETLKTHDLKKVQDVREEDNIVDDLYGALKQYMASISGQDMDKKESKRFLEILTFATNLEHIGDIIEKSLMELSAKKIRNQYMFSDEGFKEISNFHAAVMENLQLAQNIFMSGDVDMARRLVEEKAAVRKSERRASKSHIDRLRRGVAETVATSSLHLDILRDLRRINSYLTTIAYPILEDAGALHKTHLKKDKASSASMETNTAV